MTSARQYAETLRSIAKYKGPVSEFVDEYRALIVFAFSMILAILLCFGFTFWQVKASQLQWCQALQTLTEHPPPKPADPKENPSRQESYILYTEFVAIKRGFGCG